MYSSSNFYKETFAQKTVLFLGSKIRRFRRGKNSRSESFYLMMPTFCAVVNEPLSRACAMNIRNALAAFLTMHRSEMAFMQRSRKARFLMT